MKIKKEYIILAVIIIGLSVYLYSRNTDRTLYELPELPEVNEKEITRLEIKKGETAIVLKKKDDKWYIAPAEYPTDADKVRSMLDALKDFELTALVSESKNYNRYELDEAQKINIRASRGEDLKLNIDVGKTAPSFRHTFVRPDGDERVFHAQGNLKNTFDVTMDSLRDKRVLSFKPDEIQQVNVVKDNNSLAFTRSQAPVEVKAPEADKSTSAAQPTPKTVWQAANGKPVDESALNQLLGAVSNLRCETFIDDRNKKDFTSPLFSLEVKGAQDFSLAVFSRGEDQEADYPAISSGSDYPFLLASSTVDRIMKDPADLLQKPESDEKKTETEKMESQ